MGFVITQVSNIVLVYAVDAHRPIAGEVVVSQLSFKGPFLFVAPKTFKLPEYS